MDIESQLLLSEHVQSRSTLNFCLIWFTLVLLNILLIVMFMIDDQLRSGYLYVLIGIDCPIITYECVVYSEDSVKHINRKLTELGDCYNMVSGSDQ